jgi:hypothetical protein
MRRFPSKTLKYLKYLNCIQIYIYAPTFTVYFYTYKCNQVYNASAANFIRMPYTVYFNVYKQDRIFLIMPSYSYRMSLTKYHFIIQRS